MYAAPWNHWHWEKEEYIMISGQLWLAATPLQTLQLDSCCMYIKVCSVNIPQFQANEFRVNNNVKTILKYYRSQILHSLSKAHFDRVKYIFPGMDPGG